MGLLYTHGQQLWELVTPRPDERCLRIARAPRRRPRAPWYDGHMDENQLYGATLDRVYRLALLAGGSPRAAARLARQAYGRRNPAAPGSEADAQRFHEANLARALLSARPPRRWPWRPDPAAAPYAGLAPAELEALRAALAAAAPAARLALGSPHVAGIDITETNTPEPPPPDARWPRRAGDRYALLAEVARAWGMLPAGAAYPDVYEQALLLAGALRPEHEAALRALLLAGTPAAERLRATRDGLRRAEARLAAALPALFGGEAPAALREALAAPARPEGRAPMPATRLRLALVAAVALLALAVVALPRPGPPAAPAAPAAAAARPPEELVRAALTRLQRPAGAGVLHERFVASAPGHDWSLERWQELAPPHRFRVEVRDDGDRLRFALASDGVGTVQQRDRARNVVTLLGADYRLDPDVLATMLPILRQQPDGMFMLIGSNGGYNLERYYLNQALEAPLRDLGGTVAAGRPARLLAFESPAPVPPSPDDPFEAAPADPAQVLLAIDAATSALLEARVLPAGDGATGAVSVPWHADVYELLDAAPAATFTLPPPEADEAGGLALLSPRLLGAPEGMLVDLGRAAGPEGAPLYFPAGEAGIGYGISYDRGWTVLVRETVDDVVQLIPFADGGDRFVAGPRSARQAGERSYELIYPEDAPPGRTLSVATVFLGPDRTSGMHVIYSHAYAPQAEREARLEALIRSLAPLEVGG